MSRGQKLLLALIGLFELGVIPNHKAGFYCNDPALSFPFNGDTVTTEILMSTLLVGPIVFHSSLLRAFYYHFPIISQSDHLGYPARSEYVKDFRCTSMKYASWYQMDSYRSFPSGHTSLSVYCGLFIAWYLQRRAFDWSHRSIFMVPMLQLLCISYAAVCSLTRITDHRHHWWDVLVGSFIGVVTVLYAVIISSNFSNDHSKISDLKSQESRQTVRTLLYDERRPVTVS
ncbi:hypothetical protein HF086_014356 [Spodoptera exigua]|uniref:Phosphatidic acid phosphatase type 2/haloperoxidase domain-containing protein n=1 Tax=Spodoptera exigua TaxID=7107 RepID=A0A922M8H8_SPOEX|nr:hypothetical protein HF086_014356 [Spodoptera exigua]